MAERASTQRKDPARTARTRRVHLLVLLAAVAVTFASAVPGSFIWTDHALLVDAGARITRIADLGALFTLTDQQFAQRLLGDVPTDPAGGWWPFAVLSQSLDWALWGACASCVRIENLLWHFAITLGCYVFGRHLLSRRRHSRRIAFWAALAFAVHPLAVSVVSWPGGRPALLAAACSVWAMVLFVQLPAERQSRPSPIGERRMLLLLAALTLAALTSHETAFMLLPTLPLIAWFELRERAGRDLRGVAVSSARWRGIVVVVSITMLVLLYRFVMFGGVQLADHYPAAGLLSNLGTSLNLFWSHVQRVLLPGEPTLSDAFELTAGWGPLEGAAALGLLGTIAAAVIGLAVVNHPAAFGVLWFLIWQLPGSGFFPGVHYVSEASLYPAYWGLLWALAFLIMQAWRPLGRQLARGMEAIIFVPLVLLLALVTAFSNARWWNDQALFESELDLDPNFLEGRLRLGDAALHDGRPEEALNHGMYALEVEQQARYSSYRPVGAAERLVGQAQLALGQYQSALQNFQFLLDATPHLASSWQLRALARLGIGDTDGAVADLQQALRLRPDWPPTRLDLGRALIRAGSVAEGVELLSTGLDNPAWATPERLEDAADGLIALERYAEAAHRLDTLLRIEESADVRARLALVHWRLGDRQTARKHLEVALEHDGEASDHLLRAQRLIDGGGG